MRKEHETQIENAIQALKARGEVNEVYFVACGGSQAVLMAGQYLFDRESNVPSHVYTANEFVYDTPKKFMRKIFGDFLLTFWKYTRNNCSNKTS